LARRHQQNFRERHRGTAAPLSPRAPTVALSGLKYRTLQSGNWNDFNTWQLDSGSGFVSAVSGQTPSSADDTIEIQNGHLVTVTASVDADQLTVDSGGTLSVNNGVTFTIADGAGTDLTGNGTVATGGRITNNGQLVINGTFQLDDGGYTDGNDFTYNATLGTLKINNTGGEYNVLGYNFWPVTNGPPNVNVGGAGGSISLNVPRTISGLFQYAAGIKGGNNLTINGTLQVNTGGFILSPPTYGGSSLLRYNTGSTYVRHGEWGVIFPSGYPHDVQLSNNTTLDLGNTGYIEHMSGSLTIDSGSQMRLAGTSPPTAPLIVLGSVTNNGTLTLSSAAGGDLNVGGNFTNAGTYTHNSRTLTFNGASAQTWSNSTVGQNFGAVVINSAGGVTLNSFINCSQLALTNGKVTTTSVLSYSLTVTDTSTGAISGGSASSYVNGKLARILPASLTSGSTYFFPVGKGTFNPFELFDPTTNSGGTTNFQAEVFDGNCGGTAGAGLGTLNNNGCWQGFILGNAGNFTDTKVRLTDSTVVNGNRIGKSPTVGGTYDSIGGSVSGSTITSNTITSFSFFNIGTAPNVTFNSSGSLAAGTYHDITINNCGTFVNLTGDVTITGTLTINACAHLQTDNHVVSGSGALVLASGGWLHIGDANGITSGTTLSGSIQVTGGRTYSSAGNYVYTGTANQAVGNGLPGTIASLLISNTGSTGNNTVTGNGGQMVSGLLEIISGIYSSHSTYVDVQIDSSGTLSLAADITVSGNWTNNGTFTPNGFKVTFDGTGAQTITTGGVFAGKAFAGFAVNKSSGAATLAGDLSAATLDVTAGGFNQGASFAVATGAVNIGANGTWQNFGTGALTLAGNLSNSGTINLNSNGQTCGDADSILVRSSVNGTRRTWSGNGTFLLVDVNIKDQATPALPPPAAILVRNGTDAGNNSSGWIFDVNCLSGTYTWIGNTPGTVTDWTVATNWTPVRTTPSTADVLLFDGGVTPSPTVTNVPTETDAALRLTNGVNVTLNASVLGARTLTLSGATNNDLQAPAGTLLTVGGSSALTISLTAGASSNPQGNIGGQIILQGGAHRLIGSNAGEIHFANGSIFATATGFSGNPFGAGTNSSISFQSGSSAYFNAGDDPFGGDTHSIVVFTQGSSQSLTVATAFSSAGRTYGNLTLDGSQAYVAAGSSTNAVFGLLTLKTGSSLTLSPSAGGDLILLGDFTNSGTLSVNGRAVLFQGGSNTQTINGDVTFFDLVVGKIGGSVKIVNVVTVNGALKYNGTTDVLDLFGHNLILNGTIGGTNASGALDSTVSGADLTIGGTGALGSLRYLGTTNLKLLTVNRSTNGSVTLGTNFNIGSPTAGALTLTNGVVNTGSNTLSLAAFPDITRTNGYVIGNLQKTFGATGPFVFTVGTANAYSPVDANVTANSSGTLTVKAIEGKQPNIAGTNALQRYWTLNGSGITTDLTFHYRGGAPAAGDVLGNEGLYKVFKYGGSFTQPPNQSVNAGAHTAIVTGVNSFSDWTLAESIAVNGCPTSFTVNDLGDTHDATAGDGVCADSNNKCTLRAAVEEANALSSCGTITIDATSQSGTIALTNAQLVVDHNLTINGPGAGTLIVDGSNSIHVFDVKGGRSVSISGLTVTGGNGGSSGGGIYNGFGSTLTLTNITVKGNSSGFGGGIYNAGGGALTLTNSTVSGNTASSGDGGGIFKDGGTLTLTDSTVSGNTASGTSGGGIFFSNTTTVMLTNSTVSSNTAVEAGGIFGTNSTLGLTNSTVSGNSATFGNGGGIELDNGTLTLTNSTVTGNSANDGGAGNGSVGNGGGIALYSSTGNARNTIIAGNSNTATSTGPDVLGSFTSQGHNLIGIGDGGSGFTGTADQVGSAVSPIDPKLGPLASNGGPTQTHALGFGSSAIDAGDDCVLNNSCNPLPLGFNLMTDQRGVARPQGNHIDIGAFELQAYVVSTTADTNNVCVPGNCSLREAINAANLDTPDPRMIVFNILSGDSGCASGVCTITPSPDALPTIVNSIFIDGYSQTGSKLNDLNLDAGDNAVLTIQLNGARLPNGSRGLNLQNGSDWSVIRGLIIHNFEGAGVWLENDGANQISGNFIGANSAGDAAAANGDGGAIAFGIFNLIGGDLPAERNVISGNRVNGIRISGDEATDNDVEGNYIGTTRTGDAALANPVGVYVNAGSIGNVIGCKVINGDNLISGNTSAGVRIEQSAWNLVEGNFIGTNKMGTAAIPNAIGVDLKNAPLNTIGLPKLGNLISGNTGAGLLIGSTPSTTLPSSINDVQGNRIGSNAAGTGPLPNNVGILIRDASDNLIGGGVVRSDRNYISGNTLEGIRIEVSGPTALSERNQIFGNYIGTNFTGTAAISNGTSGVKIAGGFQNEVGCAFSGSGNLISGNAGEGVELTGGGGKNFVQGNFIGVKSDLTSDLGNTGSGVEIYSLPNQPSLGNVVGVLPDSGNSRTCLDSIAAKTGPCRAQPERNTLREARATTMRSARQKTEGTRADSAPRKEAAGIRPLRRISNRNQAPSDRFAALTQEPESSAKQITRVGPTVAPSPTPGPTPTSGANVIAFNHHDGVKISTAGDVDNLISQNSIFSNAKLGINLVAATDPISGAREGVTDNDAGDGDDGPNHLQNFPIITDAAVNTQTIYGTLDSLFSGQSFTIEFFVNDDCDGSGNGEGKTFIGFTRTSVSNFSFTAPSGSFIAGKIITATATDAKGNTSEFSSCFTATPVSAGADLYIQKTDSPDPVTAGNDLTYTLTVFSKGPAAATNVQVTHALPDGVTFVSSTPSQGTCSGTTTVACNLGAIYNGGTATVKILVKAPNTPGSISNSASVSSPDDPVNGNNTASAGTQVNACPTTFTVKDNGDAAAVDGVCASGGAGCTLRAAITEANALPACGTIDINFSGVTGAINLATALPPVNHNININGPGATVLTVKRNSAAQFRVFKITPGRTVAISGLTIANGLVSGIYPANSGGGTYNDHGSLSLRACVVSGNTATGGAIFNDGQTGTASLTVTDSSIRDNAATESGGGIYNLSGTVTVKGSTISNNSAVELGGGILNTVGGLTLINTTISGNRSQLHGGGIYNYSGGNPSTTTAINVTLTNNRSDSNNDTLGDGGGIFIEGGNVLLRNTIVARNFKGASPGTTAHDVFGTLDNASSFNLIGDGTGINGFGSLPSNNQIGTAASPINPLLGVLQDNGGPTFTHALLYNSPAVDKGDNATTSTPLFLTTDQRGSGFARQSDGDLTAGAIIDMGAYERQSTERRTVSAGANSQVDLVDVKLTLACVPKGGCGTFKASEEGPQTRADLNPETRPSASIIVIDPAAQPTPPAGYVAGNNSSPPLPAFDLSTTASFDGPIALCFYLPTITNAGFFGGLKLLHNEGGTLVDRTTSQNFASKILCGSVSSLSPFVIAHTVTPTAANGKVSGQIVDSVGRPVEGAGIRMSGTQNRLTVTDANGNYSFDNVETNGFYTVVPSRANYSFSPAQRSFSVLGQQTEAAFNASPASSALNPLDTTEYFVRQQYLDFLGREPDEAGLNFWCGNIESCGNDANCRAAKRIDTSAAFFLSIEFQQTGYLVYRTYRAAYGSSPNAPLPIRLDEFKPDTAEIGNGVVVLKSGWETVLENNKQAYVAEFVRRARFINAFAETMSPADFVDRLFANAGVTPSAIDRSAAINEFGAASTTADEPARARALRRVAENSTLAQQEFNQAFVLMQYFGYLRRDPNSGLDRDLSGYSFWLEKLNSFQGNFRDAEMVRAFLVSGEFRGRFPR
jgi:CSLREA domain-containing protein